MKDTYFAFILVMICHLKQSDSAPAHVSSPWPNGVIPYSISSRFTSNQKEIIGHMMKKVENVSCVKFKPITTETTFLDIKERRYLPCTSFIGYRSSVGGRAMILNDNCMNENDILHELMHVLGFHHEHTRTDRDNYVTINYKNIMSRYMVNFQKRSFLEPILFNLTYDFNSVTHISHNAFAINASIPTIVPNDEQEIKADGLSEKDILKINRYYRCNE